jgi:heme-degrading monooxygenase HmoA
MYAVVAEFTMDRARDEEHRRTMKEEVIPITRQVPGFVSGYWMNEPTGPKSYVLTVWDTEEQARAFVRVVEARMPQGEQAGVGYDSLTVVEVIGEAHR